MYRIRRRIENKLRNFKQQLEIMQQEKYNKETTVHQAKIDMRLAMDKGIICPCCNQNVKMYRWRISAVIAKCLLDMYKLSIDNPKRWVHPLHDLEQNSGDYAKLRYFGLIESDQEVPEEDKKASGFWRITPLGKSFVLNRATVALKVKIYNQNSYGFEGKQISIIDALGKKFSYSELMNDSGDGKTPDGNKDAI